MHTSKKLLRVRWIPLMIGTTLLISPKESRADVSVSVTKQTFTTPIDHPGTIIVPFTADVTGLPTANEECTVTGPTYRWTLTVNGRPELYSSTSAYATVRHNTGGSEGTVGCGPGLINVVATCTITFTTSSGCEGGALTGPQDDDDSAVVRVNAVCSPPQDQD